MIKGDLYYRFLAPMFVAKKGLALTQENIDAEIKNLKALDNQGIEDNILTYNITFTNDIRQVFSDTPIYGLNNGNIAKIKYKIGEGGIQELDCYVNEINGCRSLADIDNHSDIPTLVGDDINNVKLYLYLNTKDLVNVNNGSVSFIETNGNYSNDMPTIKIISITKA